MKTFLPLALGLLLCAPVTAQRMGSANTNAPTVSHAIDFADGTKVACEYVAIVWGRTMERLANKETGQRIRDRVNQSAKDAPLGEFTASTALKIGDKKLAAGEYKVYFTITENIEWQLNFGNDDSTVTITLPLKDSPTDTKRLLIGMYAGEGEKAGLYVAFGKQSCDLQIERGGEKGEKKDKSGN